MELAEEEELAAFVVVVEVAAGAGAVEWVGEVEEQVAPSVAGTEAAAVGAVVVVEA